MAERSKTTFQDSYLRDLTDLVDDYALICSILAQDWPEKQAESGLTVSSYLRAYEDEVTIAIHDTSLDISSHAQSYRKQLQHDVGSGNLIDQMTQAKTLSAVRALYENRDNEHGGLPGILYIQALLDDVTHLGSRKDPWYAIDKISAHIDRGIPGGDALVPVFRAAIDTNIYYGARHARDPRTSKDRLQFASTDMARTAMNNALDYKVLKFAQRREANKEVAESADLPSPQTIVYELGSSDIAKEALVSYLAKTRPASGYRRGYLPQVSPMDRAQLKTSRRLVRLQEESERYLARERKLSRDRVYLRDELNRVAREALETLGYTIDPSEELTHLATTAYLIIHAACDQEESGRATPPF